MSNEHKPVNPAALAAGIIFIIPILIIGGILVGCILVGLWAYLSNGGS